MIKTATRYLLLFVATIVMLSFGGPRAWAAEQTVKVGVYDNPPKVYVDKSGNAQGLFPDILNAIAQKEGWTIQYVNGTWAQGLQRVASGEIDIMTDMGYTEDRARTYDLNQVTVIANWGQIFAHKGVIAESMLDLDGKTVAVMKGDIHYIGPAGIKNLAKSFGLNVKFLEVAGYAEILKAVESGRADVGAVNRLFGTSEASKYKVVDTGIVFNPIEMHFALTKDNPRNSYLISKIDDNLKAMKSDSNSTYYKSLESHLINTVEKVSAIPFWLTVLLWSIPAVLLLALLVFFAQRRYQKHLKKVVDAKVKELTESELTYKNLFETSKDAITIHDRGRYLNCNKAALDMFKIATVEEFITKSPAELSPAKQPSGEDSFQLARTRIEQAYKEGSLSFEWVHRRSDGSLFDADVLLTKVIIKNQEVLQATVRDISEQKKALARVREVNDLRNEFIKVVSHQLRTPMNTVNWNLEMLISGDLGSLTDAQKEFLRSTHGAETNVINRLGDLLTVIDIEEGRVITNREDVSLESLYESTSGMWKTKFQTKKIALEYAKPTDTLPVANVDAGKIRKVFDYLLSNAFDYTPAGGVVTAKLLMDNRFIRFELTDTGVGIPQAEQPRIFAKFFRATNASAMTQDRSGICLAICKYYIEQAGGTIGFVSREGSGSTFWFELPTDDDK